MSQAPLPPLNTGLGSFPFARRYSENRYYFLFLRLLRCFSSAGWLPLGYYRVNCNGLPHSDIPGSKLAYSSPRLFAVSHVLLRLLVPRYPPYALSILIFCFPQISLLYYMQFSMSNHLCGGHRWTRTTDLTLIRRAL